MNQGLGEFEQLVFLALVRLGADAYGVAVRDEIEQQTGRDVTLGAVYTTLLRLEHKGFVSSRLGDPTPQRGGRRKKYYRPLAAGRRELAASLRALQHDARPDSRPRVAMKTVKNLRGSNPPWLAVRILSWRIPEPDREYLIGDLIDRSMNCGSVVERGRRVAGSGAKHCICWLPDGPRPRTFLDLTAEAPMDSLLRRCASRSVRSAALRRWPPWWSQRSPSVWEPRRPCIRWRGSPYSRRHRTRTAIASRSYGSEIRTAESNLGYATFEDLSREDRVFESAAAMSYWFPTLNDGSETTRLAGQR
jgi:DNA-binding PadR family transcriptional regulator